MSVDDLPVVGEEEARVLVEGKVDDHDTFDSDPLTMDLDPDSEEVATIRITPAMDVTTLKDCVPKGTIGAAIDTLARMPGGSYEERLQAYTKAVAGTSVAGRFGEAVEAECARRAVEAEVGAEANLDNLEVEEDLGESVLLFADLGYFTYFQTNSTTQQEADFHAAIQDAMIPLLQRYGFGVTTSGRQKSGLFSPDLPAADEVALAIRRDPSLSAAENAKRIYTIGAAFHKAMNSIPVPNEELRGDSRYPNGCFQAKTVGVYCGPGELKARAFTAKADLGKGFAVLSGEGMVKVKTLEGKGLERGECRMCDKLAASMREAGVEIPEGDRLRSFNSAYFLETDDSRYFHRPPQTKLTPNALHVLRSVFSDPAAMDDWIQAHAEGTTPTRCVERQQDLGQISIICDVDDPNGEKIDVYRAIIALLNEERFRPFMSLKNNKGKMFFKVNLDLVKDSVLLFDFIVRLGKILGAADLPITISSARSHKVVRVPVKCDDDPSETTAIEDLLSPATTKAVRLVQALKGSLTVDMSVLLAAGYGHHEMSPVALGLKGFTDIAHVLSVNAYILGSVETGEDLIRELTKGRELIGVDVQQSRLRNVMENPGQPSRIVVGPAAGIEDGCGSSALFRWLKVEHGDQILNVTPVGNDDMAMTRGFLCAYRGGVFDRNANPQQVRDEASRVAAEGITGFAGVVFDGHEYGVTDQELLPRLFVSAMQSGGVTFFVTPEFPGAADAVLAEKLELGEFTSGGAAELMARVLGVGGDFAERALFLEQVVAAIEVIRGETGVPKLTARNIIHVFALALDESGRSFDMERLKNPNVRPGALISRLRSSGISPVQQRVLQFLGSIQVPLAANDLWRAYKSCGGGGDEMTETQFQHHLEFLLDRGFLSRVGSGAIEGPDYYCLANLAERSAIQDLTTGAFDVKAISGQILSALGGGIPKLDNDAEVILAEGILHHLIESGEESCLEKARELANALGQHYFGSRRIDAARRVYRNYWNFESAFHGSARLDGANEGQVSFYFNMAWVFNQSGDPEDHASARQLYNSLLEASGLSPARQVEAYFGQYRLLMQGCDPLTDAERVALGGAGDNEFVAGLKRNLSGESTDDASRAIARQPVLLRLIEKVKALESGGTDACKDGLIECLEWAELYQRTISIMRSATVAFSAEQAPGLRNNLGILGEVQGCGKLEHRATAIRMRAGVLAELGDATEGDLVNAEREFELANGAFEELDVPDYIQAHGAALGRLVVLQKRFQAALSDDRSGAFGEDEVRFLLGLLDQYRALAEGLRKSCSRLGDGKNLFEALAQIANTSEFSLILAGKAGEHRTLTGVDASKVDGHFAEFDARTRLALLIGGLSCSPEEANPEGYVKVRVACDLIKGEGAEHGDAAMSGVAVAK